MTTFLKAGEGSIFIQPLGPNTPLYYLGCHQLGDVTIPKGDKTLRYVPDPSAPNKWKVSNSWKGAPGPVTGTIEIDMALTMDWMEKLNCPATLYVMKTTCARMDDIQGWERLFIFPQYEITNEGLAALTAKDPEAQEASMINMDWAADEMLKLFKFNVARQSIAETGPITSISFCGNEQCSGHCGSAEQVCDYGVLASSPPAGSPTEAAKVWYTEDGGGTWTVTADDPFASAEVIAQIVCFQMSPGVRRFLAVRGTTDAGAAAEVAYSDDQGATWVNVDVGTSLGKYAMGPHSMVLVNKNNIWLVTTGGYIYKSEDGGETWVTQAAAAPLATNLIAVDFLDTEVGFVVGAADGILYTEDGGENWTLAPDDTGTGDDILSVAVHSSEMVWIETDEGNTFYSTDGGETWISRAGYPGSGTGDNEVVRWYDPQFGVLVHNSTVPVGSLLYTFDGGYNWFPLVLPGTNTGLNDVFVCSPQEFFAVGNVQSGSPVIYKVSVPVTNFS